MTDFLFLQRFRAGAVERLSLAEVIEALDARGPQHPWPGGLEIELASSDLADLLLLVGDAATGVRCIALLGPSYEEDLREKLLRCMERLGVCAYDGALTRVLVPWSAGPEAIADLPPELAREAAPALRRVSESVQLWPDWMRAQRDLRDRVMVVGLSMPADTPHMQYFDAQGADGSLEFHLALHPAACNADTAGAVRMLQARAEKIAGEGGQRALACRFDDPETPLRLAEAGGAAPASAHPWTVVAPWSAAWNPRGFVSDRELFASFSTRAAQAVQHAQAQFGLALDSTAASAAPLAEVLDRLHAQFRAGGLGDAQVSWAMDAGSYLSLVVCRALGAQVGYVRLQGMRVPCVRMHTGRVHYPALRVLDHIVNGPQDSVRDWLEQVASTDTSRLPREQDWLCDLPGYCDILRGRADLTGGELPLHDALARERLDFSVESLRHLDDWLAQVREQGQGQVEGSVVVAAGAYLGEVVRSGARESWVWASYDDVAAADPEFARERPRGTALLAFLDGPQQRCYPLAHVAAVLAGLPASTCHAFALALQAPPQAAPATQQAEDGGEPAFCPNCAHPLLSRAPSCERCGAAFPADGAWRPVATSPEPMAPQTPAAAAPSGESRAARYLLRAGHVCLVGPLLHFASVSAAGSAPVDAIGRLLVFVPFLYAAGGLAGWHARRQHALALQARTDTRPFEQGAWDMEAYERLPVGLRVTHTPAKTGAVAGGPSGLAFSWVCATSVTALQEPVEVRAFAAAHFQGGRWVLVKTFKAQEFADWYGCAGGRIAPGQTCTDAGNWTGATALRQFMTRWCYVGVTGDGRVVRGDAAAHHAARLAD